MFITIIGKNQSMFVNHVFVNHICDTSNPIGAIPILVGERKGESIYYFEIGTQCIISISIDAFTYSSCSGRLGCDRDLYQTFQWALHYHGTDLK